MICYQTIFQVFIHLRNAIHLDSSTHVAQILQKGAKTATGPSTLKSLLGIYLQDTHYSDSSLKLTVNTVRNFRGDSTSGFIADFGQVFGGWLYCEKELIFN